MKWAAFWRTSPSFAAAVVLSSCTGLFTPNLQEPFHADPDFEKIDESHVVGEIQCELEKAVYNAVNDPHFPPGPNTGNGVGWLQKWGAKVTLTLTVDEKGSANPGITYFVPFENSVKKFSTGTVTTAQSFSLGMGLQASSDATRKETISYTYAFADLLKQKSIDDKACPYEDGVTIHSDLKISDFVRNKVYLARLPGLLGVKTEYSPYTAFSDEVSFIVIYGGSLNPVWKFVTLSGNTSSSPLLNSTRTKTQDVLITLGLVTETPGQPPTLSSDANAVHSAGLIGQAVSTSNASQTPP
jgi:hypothetical protein